eukprot:TRINITY_DN41716_c0_g1_i1.p1 TRINITY_DN41716_c0_g1~~TRINITY_DN41716_c0_g1_i1.p1  ORF type:complete len:773 (-),score=147.78 TRINITY_DN41716_c0_g1_i1:181-2499(-)
MGRLSGLWSNRPSVVMSRTESDNNERIVRKYGRISQGSFEYTCIGLWRANARSAITHPLCDTFLACVIIINCVFIGVEQSYRRAGEGNILVFAVVENLFLLIYLIELLLRFFADGWACLSDNFVKLDLFLVMMAVISEWVMALIFSEEDGNFQGVTLLRTARMARVARSLRLFKKFPGLSMLIQGISNSANTIAYALTLLGITLYVFASLGFELITLSMTDPSNPDPPPEEVLRVIEEYFPSVQQTMLSLMQFVTMDSLGIIYRPLAVYQPALSLYFILLIIFVSILTMNIITAVLVNGAIETAQQDRDTKRSQIEHVKTRMMKQLKEMFESLDADGSGTIDREELETAGALARDLMEDFLLTLNPLEVFDALDVDESGLLTISEFCDGLYQIAVSKTPLEIKRMDKKITAIHHKLYTVDRDEARKQRPGVNEKLSRSKSFFGESIFDLLQDVKVNLHDVQDRLNNIEVAVNGKAQQPNRARRSPAPSTRVSYRSSGSVASRKSVKRATFGASTELSQMREQWEREAEDHMPQFGSEHEANKDDMGKAAEPDSSCGMESFTKATDTIKKDAAPQQKETARKNLSHSCTAASLESTDSSKRRKPMFRLPSSRKLLEEASEDDGGEESRLVATLASTLDEILRSRLHKVLDIDNVELLEKSGCTSSGRRDEANDESVGCCAACLGKARRRAMEYRLGKSIGDLSPNSEWSGFFRDVDVSSMSPSSGETPRPQEAKPAPSGFGASATDEAVADNNSDIEVSIEWSSLSPTQAASI